MAVDKRADGVDSHHVLLGQAVKSALGTRSQSWLAKAVGLDDSQVTRLVRGQLKEVTIDRVRAIEDALSLHPGALLRAAGYVADVVTIEDAIRNDARLDADKRAAVLGALNGVLETLS